MMRGETKASPSRSDRPFQVGRPDPDTSGMALSTGEEEQAQRFPPSPTVVSASGLLPVRHRRVWFVVGLVACLVGTSIIGIALTARSPAATTPTAGTIADSFNSFFDFSSGTVTNKLAVVEGGGTLRRALTEALSNPFARAATGAKVEAIKMLDPAGCAQASLSAPCALVTYDVVGAKDAVILPNSQGYAVTFDGRWRVARVTVCELFELFYQASAKTGTPPGC
jgi:hypothetical protein